MFNLFKKDTSERRSFEILHILKGKAENILQDKQKTDEMLEKVYKLCDKMSNIPIIGEAFAEIPWVGMLISDHVNGFYKEIPLATILTLTAAILYLVSPIDLVPDGLPIVGQIDDWAVIIFALKTARNDLNSYKEWKLSEEETDE